MIKGAETDEEIKWCRELLGRTANILLSPTAHIVMWVSEGVPTWVVAYDDWLGWTCMMYVASVTRFPPRAFRWAVFNYAFNIIDRKIVFGMVKSNNTKALRLDLFLGFKEVYRAPGCAEGGHDIILLEMKADDWRARNGKKITASIA